MKNDVIQAHVDIATICIKGGMTLEMIENEFFDLSRYAQIMQDAKDAEEVYLKAQDHIRAIIEQR